jgi:hypothetical protein
MISIRYGTFINTFGSGHLDSFLVQCPQEAKICNSQIIQIMKKILQFLPYPVISPNLKRFLYFNLIHSNIIDRSRLLVVPQELRVQVPLFKFIKSYHTRRSGSILGKLQGFMNLPMDVVFEVSIHTYRLFKKKLVASNVAWHFLPSF